MSLQHPDNLIVGDIQGPLLNEFYGSMFLRENVMSIAREVKGRYLAKLSKHNDTGNLAATARVYAHRSKDHPDRRWEAEFRVGGPRAGYVVVLEAEYHLLAEVLNDMGHFQGDMGGNGPTGKVPQADRAPQRQAAPHRESRLKTGPVGESLSEAYGLTQGRAGRRREEEVAAPSYTPRRELDVSGLDADERRRLAYLERTGQGDSAEAEGYRETARELAEAEAGINAGESRSTGQGGDQDRMRASRPQLETDINEAADVLARARPGSKAFAAKMQRLVDLNEKHRQETGRESGQARFTISAIELRETEKRRNEAESLQRSRDREREAFGNQERDATEPRGYHLPGHGRPPRRY